MTTIRFAPLIAALALVFVLAACGSAPPQLPIDDTPPPIDDTPPPPIDDTPPPIDDDPGTGAAITKIGLIDLAASDTGFGLPQILGSGVFFGTNVAIPVDELQSPYADMVGMCEVSGPPSDPGDVDIPSLPGDIFIAFLDGGDALTVNRDGMPFATLERETATFDGDTIIVYAIVEDLEGALPEGLTATVPGGDQFPAFTNEAFPSVGTFALTAPASGATIDPDTVFAWEPSGTSHAFVTIMVVGSDLATFVTCVASDADGSLAFSPAVKAELGVEFAGSLQLVERAAVRVATHASEGAALILMARSSTMSPFLGFPEDPGFELPDLP